MMKITNNIQHRVSLEFFINSKIDVSIPPHVTERSIGAHMFNPFSLFPNEATSLRRESIMPCAERGLTVRALFGFFDGIGLSFVSVEYEPLALLVGVFFSSSMIIWIMCCLYDFLLITFFM